MNKKLIFKALSFLMLVSIVLAFCIIPAGAEKEDTWEPFPSEAGLLPEDAQTAFDAALAATDDAVYTPVALLSTQKAAGTNYCILCQISPTKAGSAPYWALVYLAADLQGNAEVTNVYELYIARHAYPTK